MPETASFPRSPAEHDLEWPGTQIGLSNILTRSRSRAPLQDGDVDSNPGRFERLLASARRASAGRQLFIHDVAIHGVRVRAHTNSHHLADFWRRNWYSVEEWREITGVNVGTSPRVRLYAFGGVEDQSESAHFSRRHASAFLFNTSWYEEFREAAISAVGSVLAEEEGIHTLRLGAVSRPGRGAILCPSGTALSVTGQNGTRFHSNDLTFVRCGFPRVFGGEFVSPRKVRTVEGKAIAGVHCFRWLEENRDQPDATVEALSLWNEPVELRARDLDLDRPLAVGFVSEKSLYLRTDAIKAHPALAAPFLRAPLENVPDTVELEASRTDALEKAVADPSLRRLPPEALRVSLRRLGASELCRAMVDPRALFGEDRVSLNPLHALHIRAAGVPAGDETEAVRALRLCTRVVQGADGTKLDALFEES